MPKKVLVIAISKGFYHGLRDVGDQFEVDDTEVDKSDKAWFKPVAPVAPVANDNYSRMNKEQLLETATSLNLEVNSDMTKAQIIELLTAE